MLFNVSEVSEWGFYFRKIWNEVESQLFEKQSAEPIKQEGKYMHDKPETLKGCLRTNFHGQDIHCQIVVYTYIGRNKFHIICNATVVLSLGSVYKDGKN